MTGHEHDEALAQLLHRTLTDEADGVMPAGDGLSRIRAKIAARRRRLLWLRPAAALGAAAAVAAVAFGAYALVGSGGPDRHVITPATRSATSEPTPNGSTSPTPVPTTSPPAFPPLAIYPFTSQQAAVAWDHNYVQQVGPASPYTDPKQVALLWVRSIGVTDLDQTVSTNVSADDSTAVVELGRVMAVEQQQTIPVTDVHLVHYLDAWLVVGATDPQGFLRITSPVAGDGVNSPLTVSGPTWGGVEESVNFDLRTVDDAGHSGTLATGNAFFGNGPATWSTTIHFSLPHDSRGALVGVENSQADGGTQRLVAQPVDIRAMPPVAAPAYFYGIKNGRVTKFASSSGAPVAYVSPAGGGAGDPQLTNSNNEISYLQAGTGCANALMSVPVAGGGATLVATPERGYAIKGYGIAPDGTEAALFETACGSRSPAAKLVVRNLHLQSDNVLAKFPSLPPLILFDPVWSSDQQSIDAFVRNGNFGTVERYDANTGRTSAACPGEQMAPSAAIDVSSDGRLWLAEQTGSGLAVMACSSGHGGFSTVFTIRGNRTAADLDLSASGAVLVTDTDGHLWRWDGSGPATRLSRSLPLTQVAW